MNRSLIRIFTLFTKDLKDAIRDARVLIALIVPLGIGVFYNYTFDDTSITEIKGTVAISAADATQLPDLIKAAVPSNVHLTFESQPDQAAVEKAVGNEDADIGIVVPAGFDQAVSAGRAAGPGRDPLAETVRARRLRAGHPGAGAAPDGRSGVPGCDQRHPGRRAAVGDHLRQDRHTGPGRFRCRSS